MKVTIIGIGALGSLFAARLSSLASVSMLGHWPPQLAALQHGLWLIGPEGEETEHRVRATDQSEALEQADLILILVKSYQTERAAWQALSLLSPEGFVLTLQNGVGNLETLAATLGPERVLPGTTSEGATIVQPGVVRQAGRGQTHLAKRQGLPVADVVTLFRQAGFRTSLADDVHSLLWGKLAVNAAINPLTALLGVPNGQLLQHDSARQLMQSAAAEVAAVAAAQKITLPYESAATQAEIVARETAANRSSMLQDVLHGRQTEIEAIAGAVVRLGQKLGVRTPTNAALLKLVHILQDTGSWQQEIPTLPLDLQPLFSDLDRIKEIA